MRTRGLSGLPPKRRATRFRVARLFRTRAAYRIEAVRSLDSALFINTKDCSVDWRLEIQADMLMLHPELSTYRPLRLSAGNQEDNLRQQHLIGSSATGSDPLPQSLWRRENRSFSVR